jgi:tetratricopeptide (TPR) repeat protein
MYLAFAAALAGCATAPPGRRVDNIPMYGQPGTPLPAMARAAKGERYMRERNLDHAMRRYNQAWLLNPNNYQPYWGFARVLVEIDRLDEAIQHFETAKTLCDDSYQKIALLADAGVAHSRAGNFQRANEHFQQSTALDPKYENAWYAWSQSLYREGNHAEAWSKLKQARALGANVSAHYVRALTERMPEPQ